MTQDELNQVESSQRQHNEEMVQNEKMMNMYEQRVIKTFKNTGATLSKDGDQWCVLLGGDLQSGVCGFGETPYKAMCEYFTELGLN